jgi:hypothetical protein
VTGLLLVQSAFETAPLRMSLPALIAAQPLAGIVVGVVLLGMHPAMPCGSAGGRV